MFVDANTILPSTVKQLNHDPLKSFAPITVLGRGSHVIVAHPSLGVRTLPELVAYAKKHPGTMSYASPGSPARRTCRWRRSRTPAAST